MENWLIIIFLCGMQLTCGHNLYTSNRDSELVNTVARHCLSSHLDCGQHGSCVVDREGRTACRCQSSKKYVWGGEECEVRGEVLPVRSEYILGVSLGVTVTLVIALVLVSSEAYFKCWKKTGSRRNSSNSSSSGDVNERGADVDYTTVSSVAPPLPPPRPFPCTPCSAGHREGAAFTGDTDEANTRRHGLCSDADNANFLPSSNAPGASTAEPFSPDSSLQDDNYDEAEALDERDTKNDKDEDVDEVTPWASYFSSGSSVTSDMLYRDGCLSVRSWVSDELHKGKHSSLRSSRPDALLHEKHSSVTTTTTMMTASKRLRWDGHLTYYNEHWEGKESGTAGAGSQDDSSTTPQDRSGSRSFSQLGNQNVCTTTRWADYRYPQSVLHPDDPASSRTSCVFTLPRIPSHPKEGTSGVESRSLSSWACDHIVSQLSDTYYNNLPPRRTTKRTHDRTSGTGTYALGLELAKLTPSTAREDDNNSDVDIDVEAGCNANSLPSSGRKEDAGKSMNRSNGSNIRTSSGDQPPRGKPARGREEGDGRDKAASLKQQPASRYSGSGDFSGSNSGNCDSVTDGLEPADLCPQQTACAAGDPPAQRTYRVLLMGSLGPEPVFLYEPWRTSAQSLPTSSSPSPPSPPPSPSSRTGTTAPYGCCQEADLTIRTTATTTGTTSSHPQGTLASSTQHSSKKHHHHKKQRQAADSVSESGYTNNSTSYPTVQTTISSNPSEKLSLHHTAAAVFVD